MPKNIALSAYQKIVELAHATIVAHGMGKIKIQNKLIELEIQLCREMRPTSVHHCSCFDQSVHYVHRRLSVEHHSQGSRVVLPTNEAKKLSLSCADV